MPDNLPPIACDLTVLNPEIRDTHLLDARQLFAMAMACNELPDGYAMQLPNDSATFLRVAHFVDRERSCCPFFDFTLNLRPNQGEFWLTLTGDERIKPFIQAQLALNTI